MKTDSRMDMKETTTKGLKGKDEESTSIFSSQN
jgi:hypothetical protein